MRSAYAHSCARSNYVSLVTKNSLGAREASTYRAQSFYEHDESKTMPGILRQDMRTADAMRANSRSGLTNRHTTDPAVRKLNLNVNLWLTFRSCWLRCSEAEATRRFHLASSRSGDAGPADKSMLPGSTVEIPDRRLGAMVHACL